MKSFLKKYQLNILLLLPVLWALSGCWQHKPAVVSTPGNDSASTITLCRSYKSETGNIVGAATVFPLYGENNVRAIFDIKNLIADDFDRPQIFHIEWLDIENKLLFRKQMDLLPDDSTRWLESSISVSPQTRTPGTYQIRLYHFREMVAIQYFDLLPMDSIIQSWAQRLKAEIVIYRKADSKTGELIDVGNEFEIRERANVRTQISLQNPIIVDKHELKLAVVWQGTDSTPCYRKDITLYPGDSLADISSSINISPDKRSPGNYRLQLWLFDTIVAEKEFRLIEKRQKEVVSKKKAVSKKKKKVSRKK
ncbi:MAG TPA: hypothetical protein VFC92_00970 [Bacteroidales bacterium]|nr:hypothetical protein [Bacteroidales bacterium]